MGRIKVLRNVLEKNDKLADEIHEITDKHNTKIINIMGTPGAGKTSLLEQIIPEMQGKYEMAVLEGDVATENDAERIAELNIPTVQINTDQFGGTCHLGAEMVKPALKKVEFKNKDIIFVENVGNLICPAHFDIGADYNITVLSITEGIDKPVKYPLMFRESELAIINKIDLAQYLDLEIESMIENIKNINHDIKIYKTAATTNRGKPKLIKWFSNRVNKDVT